MLKWLDRIAFSWKSEARRRRRWVDRRLRAEVPAAWHDPSPQLRRRTIAALNDAMHQPAPVIAAPRPAGAAYAVAFLAMVVLGALAVRLSVTAPSGPDRVAKTQPVFIGFDTTGFNTLIRTHLQDLEGTLESTLRTEAQFIAADARNAGEFVHATLPLPATWGPVKRPGG